MGFRFTAHSTEPDGSDGLRVDTDGNLWCAWSGGEAEDGVAARGVLPHRWWPALGRAARHAEVRPQS